jgi:hypothetical protein
MNKCIKFGLNTDKFKIQVPSLSGFGTMRDILCPGVYLKTNEKGTIFKFKESGESVIATGIKYQGEAV